jgi:hypothetical protein
MAILVEDAIDSWDPPGLEVPAPYRSSRPVPLDGWSLHGWSEVAISCVLWLELRLPHPNPNCDWNSVQHRKVWLGVVVGSCGFAAMESGKRSFTLQGSSCRLFCSK